MFAAAATVRIPPVGPGEPERLLSRTDFFCDAIEFVIKNDAKPLGEDQRQDEILVFRRVLGPADGARGIPDPGFEGLVLFFCH